MINQKRALSGISGFDAALDYIRYGDNVVFQVSDIDGYRFFVEPFIRRALEDGKNVVYFRFGKHPALAEPEPGLRIYEIDLINGFEAAVMSIAEIIEEEGPETHYVFDSITDLQVEWVADWMVGNFFVVTAPEVVKSNSVAYFAYTSDHHSFEAVARIREAASVLLDVFHNEDHMYMLPVKISERYLPTIFLPHRVN
jgi:hypothetical protein